MSDRKYSVGIWAYGGCGDRFSENGYQKNRSFKEKLELAAKTKNLSGVEVHYNGDFKDDDFADAKKLIKSSGLQIAAVDCETFGDRKFRKGALTSTDPKIRKDAVEIVKRAGEVAKELNAAVVNLWPGADGYDYSFQLDYEKEIELMVKSIKEISKANPDVKYSLEYKIKEPRIRSTIGTAAKATALIKDAGVDNFGVTMDFGHSMVARENPAEASAFLDRYNLLYHVHLNDNSRDWDDDLIVNTYHFWETLELIYYLKKLDYNGWIGLDMSPKREDQIEAVEYSIETLERMFKYIEKIDEEKLLESLKEQDVLKAHKLINKEIFI
jgi:xylose isomerase